MTRPCVPCWLLAAVVLAVSGCASGPSPASLTPSTSTALAASDRAMQEQPARRLATPLVGPDPVATVTMRDDGCEFSGLALLNAGSVILELENRSSGQFDADLWLLNAGHSYDELAAHIAEEQRRSDAGEPGLGHPSFAGLVAEASVAADRGTLVSRLVPGTYGVACILFEGGAPVRFWAAGPFRISE